MVRDSGGLTPVRGIARHPTTPRQDPRMVLPRRDSRPVAQYRQSHSTDWTRRQWGQGNGERQYGTVIPLPTTVTPVGETVNPRARSCS